MADFTPQPPPTDKIGATPAVGPSKSEEQKMGTPAESTFKSYMEQAPVAPQKGAAAAQISPFDLAHGGALPSPSYDTLMAQTKNAQMALGGIQNQLAYPKLKVNEAHRRLLDNKLQDTNSLLRSAASKMGAEVVPDSTTSAKGVVEKFVGMVTDGQSQLVAAKRQLQNLKDKGEQINPGDMLLIQLKLNKAQQLLEFSSVVLSKAVDSFKMLMQIQI